MLTANVRGLAEKDITEVVRIGKDYEFKVRGFPNEKQSPTLVSLWSNKEGMQVSEPVEPKAVRIEVDPGNYRLLFHFPRKGGATDDVVPGPEIQVIR